MKDIEKKKLEAKFAKMTDEQLEKEYRAYLGMTHECIQTIAIIVKERVKRKLMIPEQNPMVPWLLKIADDKLIPEALEKLSERKNHVLKKMEKVDPKEQKKLLKDNKKIPVVKVKPDKTGFDTKYKTVDQLTKDETDLVFTPSGKQRKPSDQKKILTRQHNKKNGRSNKKPKITNLPTRSKKLFINPDNQWLKFGGSFVERIDGVRIHVSELLTVLTEYYNQDFDKLAQKSEKYWEDQNKRKQG